MEKHVFLQLRQRVRSKLEASRAIDYDVAEIIFHGTIQYDKSGRQIGYSKEGARMLEGMIRQVNQNIQKRFKIGKPNFLKLQKVQNFAKFKSKFLGQLNKLQGRFGLSDGERLTNYHYEWWSEYILKNVKSLRAGIRPREKQRLIYRWAYFNKDYSLGQIKKDFADRPKLLEWILKQIEKTIKKYLNKQLNHLKYYSFK